MAITLDGPALDRFLAQEPDAPVTMLNLLRFRPDGGWESYLKYTEHTRPVIARHGVRTRFFGRGLPALIAEAGQAWDAVLLVDYPSRRAFADLIRDPDYLAGAHLRTEALADSVLQPTTSLLG